MQKEHFIFLIIALVFVIPSSFSQIKLPSEKEKVIKHELRYNPVYTYIGSIDLTYERLINKKSGAGLRYMYTFIDEFIELKQDVSVFYRHYYGKKYAGGFYNEINIGYNSVENIESVLIDNTTNVNTELSHNLGIGFAFGTKLISKDRILLDLGIGMAYNTYRSDFNDRFIPKLIVNFGFSF